MTIIYTKFWTPSRPPAPYRGARRVTYISAALRREVIERSGNRREYCLACALSIVPRSPDRR